MSGPELAEWQAFERAYDLPDAFFLAGVLGPMWGGKGCKAGDLVPYYGRPERVQSAAEQKAIMAARRGEGGRV